MPVPINKHAKIIASIFTIAILSLILFTGPTKAFVLGLDSDKDTLTKGEEINFTASLDIQAMDKYLPVEDLRLVINGPTPRTCTFDIRGNAVSGCDGMTITPMYVSLSGKYGYGYGYGYDSSYGYGYDFGYGYGYGYGYGSGGSEMNLTYEIILDTTDYDEGDYEALLESYIGNQIFQSKDKPVFTINNPVTFTPSGGGSTWYYYNCGNNVCDTGESINTCPEDCSPVELLSTGIEETPEDNESDLSGFGEDEGNQETGFSKITGAVVGFAKTGKGIGLIFALIIIIFTIGILASKRK